MPLSRLSDFLDDFRHPFHLLFGGQAGETHAATHVHWLTEQPCQDLRQPSGVLYA